MWLRIAVISAHVEVLRRRKGVYAVRSKTADRRDLIRVWCTLPNLKNCFITKRCKFTFVGVDQTQRRPLAVLLFRNCCKRNCISKDNGQFQKAKLRLRRLFSLQPKVQHYSTPASLRVTKSRDQVGVHPFVLLIKYILPPKNGSFWQVGFLFGFLNLFLSKKKKV